MNSPLLIPYARGSFLVIVNCFWRAAAHPPFIRMARKKFWMFIRPYLQSNGFRPMEQRTRHICLTYFQALARLREQLGLRGSVHFLAELTDSFLPDEVIADFYRIADALFFPSREEGFGIPLIEAAFSHLPAFCADIPPLNELGLGDAAFFSPEATPAHIANIIAEYFQSSAPSRLSMRVRAMFRWETIYHQHLAPLFN